MATGGKEKVNPVNYGGRQQGDGGSPTGLPRHMDPYLGPLPHRRNPHDAT
jgi:hypothetical protein